MFFFLDIQFFIMETTANRRNSQYRMTQSPRNHVSDTGHLLMWTITGRCHVLPNQTISGLEYWQSDWTNRCLMKEEQCCQRYFGIYIYIYLGISICGGMLETNFPNTWCISSLVLLGKLFPNQKTSNKLYLERLPLDLESLLKVLRKQLRWHFVQKVFLLIRVKNMHPTVLKAGNAAEGIKRFSFKKWNLTSACDVHNDFQGNDKLKCEIKGWKDQFLFLNQLGLRFQRLSKRIKVCLRIGSVSNWVYLLFKKWNGFFFMQTQIIYLGFCRKLRNSLSHDNSISVSVLSSFSLFNKVCWS